MLSSTTTMVARSRPTSLVVLWRSRTAADIYSSRFSAVHTSTLSPLASSSKRRYSVSAPSQPFLSSAFLSPRTHLHISAAPNNQRSIAALRLPTTICFFSSKARPHVLPVKQALRRFYLKVHPDFFSFAPKQQATNTKSLARLMNFLEDARQGTMNRETISLEFFIRASIPDSQPSPAPTPSNDSNAQHEQGSEGNTSSSSSSSSSSSVSNEQFLHIRQTITSRPLGGTGSSSGGGGGGGMVNISSDIRYRADTLASLGSLLRSAGIDCSNDWSTDANEDIFGNGSSTASAGSSARYQAHQHQQRSGSSSGPHSPGYNYNTGTSSTRKKAASGWHWGAFASGSRDNVGMGSISLDEFLDAVSNAAQEQFLRTRGQVSTSYIDEAKLRLRGFRFVFQRGYVAQDVDTKSEAHQDVMNKYQDAILKSPFAHTLGDLPFSTPQDLPASSSSSSPAADASSAVTYPNYSASLGVAAPLSAPSTTSSSSSSTTSSPSFSSSSSSSSSSTPSLFDAVVVQEPEKPLAARLFSGSSNGAVTSLQGAVTVFCADSTVCHIDAGGRIVLPVSASAEAWAKFLGEKDLLVRVSARAMQASATHRRALATAASLGFHHIFSSPALRGHPSFTAFLERIAVDDGALIKAMLEQTPILKELAIRVHAPTRARVVKMKQGEEEEEKEKMSDRDDTSVQEKLNPKEGDEAQQQQQQQQQQQGEPLLSEEELEERLADLSYEADMGVLLVPADCELQVFIEFTRRYGVEAALQQQQYRVNEKRYNAETLSLKRMLGLRGLMRMPDVGVEDMLRCCARLKTAPLLIKYQLESMSLRIGTEYRYDHTGWITIPHDWFIDQS